VCLASLGHRVTLRDIDAARVAALRAGRVPIHEPGLEDLIADNRERLAFTLDLPELLAESDIVFVAIDTPPTYSGDADLTRVMGFIDELVAVGADAHHVMVMKSTVPVGTGERIRSELDARGLDSVGYVSNPEFLKEGVAIADFLEPDRVVIGAFRPEDGDRVAELYEPLNAPIVRTDVPTAEMIKYASNAFLATKISFINEIANVCEEVGADVVAVADGMGYDRRIGRAFLNAGSGFGGSCLVGDETVLIRCAGGAPRLTTLAALLRDLAPEASDEDGIVVDPDDLEVLAWRPGADAPTFERVSIATRRWFDGTVVDIATKMGRRLTVTEDHPLVVRHPEHCGGYGVKVARNLRDLDWLPVAQGIAVDGDDPPRARVLDGLAHVGLTRADVIVRTGRDRIAIVGRAAVREGAAAVRPGRGIAARVSDVMRSGTLSLLELDAAGGHVSEGDMLGTARNGTYVPAEITLDRDFWRVVGLFLAEGHRTVDGRRHRLQWSFHPTDEEDLVEEVAGYWRRLGVRATVRSTTTARIVTVSSRILAGWWNGVLGLGTNAYTQRVPDLIWERSREDRMALLSGAWRGDGSSSLVNGGPSVVLQYGTVSRELADGLLRLLGDVGIMARLRVGRVRASTRDTYWITVSGVEQVSELRDFIKPRLRSERLAAMARIRPIAPTGYARREPGCAWVRVTGLTSRPHRGSVYSLEVPTAATFVTTTGLVVHNCFPKDVAALKQLAGNSGYHFQLLTAVIEVNELQKRRIIGKLKKHLDLAGATVALMGVAFKPGTDDIREAASLVLAARLMAEGAVVRMYDPVALDAVRGRLRGVDLVDDPVEAMRGAQAAVLVTEWPEIIALDWEAAVSALDAPRLVVDGRNVLDPAPIIRGGGRFEAIGRPGLTTEEAR